MDINKITKTFTLSSDDTSRNIKYDKVNNLILNTKVMFKDTSLIFTFIDDLRGEALRNIVRKYCYKYKIKFENQIYNLLFDISRPYYTEQSNLDGVLRMCIDVLNDKVKPRDLFSNKKTPTFDIIKNKIFLWIYREIGAKFMRLLGIDKMPRYDLFIHLYDCLSDPIYEIKHINRELFIKLNELFDYQYTQELLDMSILARKKIEFMKINDHTCIPLKQPMCDFSKFNLINVHNSLVYKDNYEKQVFISQYLSLTKVILIHGPAGSGKTTAVCNLVDKVKEECRILAPTGKACDKLRSILGDACQISTIHKYIYYSEFNKTYKFFIIDESSMISLNRLFKLLKKLQDTNIVIENLLFVGDPNQLKPINRGEVFKMMINSGLFKTIKLEVNYRSEETSSISLNQNKILSGESDFIFDNQFRINRQGDVEDLLNKLRDIKDFKDTKIISPYRETVNYINDKIRDMLFKDDEKISPFFVGEIVICTKNLYKTDNSEFDVMNGEEGSVMSIKVKPTETKVLVDFGNNKNVWFSNNDLDDKPLLYLKTAYAITIHASQGSEWNNVILMIPRRDCNFRFITQNMIYTAVSRAKIFIEIYSDNLEVFARNKDKETQHIFEEVLKEYNPIKDTN